MSNRDANLPTHSGAPDPVEQARYAAQRRAGADARAAKLARELAVTDAQVVLHIHDLPEGLEGLIPVATRVGPEEATPLRVVEAVLIGEPAALQTPVGGLAALAPVLATLGLASRVILLLQPGLTAWQESVAREAGLVLLTEARLQRLLEARQADGDKRNAAQVEDERVGARLKAAVAAPITSGGDHGGEDEGGGSADQRGGDDYDVTV